jgi:hypothetical protein
VQFRVLGGPYDSAEAAFSARRAFRRSLAFAFTDSERSCRQAASTARPRGVRMGLAEPIRLSSLAKPSIVSRSEHSWCVSG